MVNPNKLRITLHEDAVSDLKALDSQNRRRVGKYIKRISTLDDPRRQGKRLKGEMSGLWSYRVGAVRVVGVVGKGNPPGLLIIAIRHRKEVYETRSKQRLAGMLDDAAGE